MNLKQARAEKRVTQAELAKKANISQTQLSFIESGRSIPRISTRRSIESILGRIDWVDARLQGGLDATAFTENETGEDRILKAMKLFINTAQLRERQGRIDFIKQAIKYFEDETKK